jgi:hypothetical protein
VSATAPSTCLRRASTTLLIAALGCGRSDAEPPRAEDAPLLTVPEVTDPACVIASGRGLMITVADVEALRGLVLPSPDFGTATRLAVDVWLATWIATGEVDHVELREKLRYQRGLAVRERHAWAARLRDAAAELELEYGPCYVPRHDSTW